MKVTASQASLEFSVMSMLRTSLPRGMVNLMTGTDAVWIYSEPIRCSWIVRIAFAVLRLKTERSKSEEGSAKPQA